ncbi:MAG: hypothetical protein HY820_28870 [Acidobacteria bacterium]|nr:hypothetical protein [Acidobacteriota bacterium]
MWKDCVIIAQGLQLAFYQHKGDRQQWLTIITEMLSDFTHPATLELIPGREEQAAIILGMYHVVCHELGRLDEAGRASRVILRHHRANTAAIVVKDPGVRSRDDRREIRWLCQALMNYGSLHSRHQDRECIAVYEESHRLATLLNDPSLLAPLSQNLGGVYRALHPRDFDKADHYLRQNLSLRAEGDRLGRARDYIQLGALWLERWYAANHRENRPRDKDDFANWVGRITEEIRTAYRYFSDAVQLLPPTPHRELYEGHFQAAQTAIRPSRCRLG